MPARKPIRPGRMSASFVRHARKYGAGPELLASPRRSPGRRPWRIRWLIIGVLAIPSAAGLAFALVNAAGSAVVHIAVLSAALAALLVLPAAAAILTRDLERRRGGAFARPEAVRRAASRASERGSRPAGKPRGVGRRLTGRRVRRMSARRVEPLRPEGTGTDRARGRRLPDDLRVDPVADPSVREER